MRILLTRRAEQNYSSIKEFIGRKWGNSSSLAFETRTIDFLRLLRNYPEMGSLEMPEKGIRAFQLTAQTRVFYRVKNDAIILLSFFDLRQHPNKKSI